jgi:hypothetical protein
MRVIPVVLQKQVGGYGEAGELSLCSQPEQLVDAVVLGEGIPVLRNYWMSTP